MSFAVAMLSIHTSPLDNPGQTRDAGGMNVYIRELARELASQNIQIDIFTRRADESSSDIVEMSSNVRVIAIKAGPAFPLHKNNLHPYTVTFARSIDQFCRLEHLHYDLIHSHYWLSGVSALCLASRWNVPHVTMFHTLGHLKQLAHPDEPEPSFRLDMEQRLMYQADNIIAATAEERSQMMDYCGIAGQKIHVIPCGVDLQCFVPYASSWAREQLGLDVGLPILLFAGRLDPFKGPDQLLRALSLMSEPCQVVIVGGQLSADPDLKQLQRLARDLAIADRVRFVGAQPRALMPLFYSAADVTVVPSYHESFGLVAVESLACGTPVIATNAGGLTSVIQQGKTGFLVSRSPECFADRLDQLLRDHSLRMRMRAAARSSVLHFDWKDISRQVYTVYSDLVSRGCSLAAL